MVESFKPSIKTTMNTSNTISSISQPPSTPVKLKTKFRTGSLSDMDKQIIKQQIIKKQLKRSNEPNKDNDELTGLTNLFEENVFNKGEIEFNADDQIEFNQIEKVDQIWKQEQTNVAITTSVFHATKPQQIALGEVNAALEIDKDLLTKYVDKKCNSKVCSSVPINQKSQDQLLFIQTLINKARKKALLDTGATLNYMSDQFYRSELIQGMNCQYRSADINVKAANRSLMKSQGIITIPLEINGRECNVDFCILEGLSHDLILGLQFCTNYRVIINTYSRKITLGLEDNSLSLCEDIKLPAYSSMKVGVKSKRHLSRTFWINGSKDLSMRFGIHVASGKGSRSDPVVLVANLTNEDMSIPAGTIVANPCKLDHDFEVNDEMTRLFSLVDSETTHDLEENPIELDEEESIKIVSQFNVKHENHRPEEILTLAKLLKKYEQVFVHNDTNLKQCPLVQHVVDTGDSQPISQPPYRTNLETKRIIDEVIKKHLSNKFIEPSSSPWASPVVLVSKKDGSVRFCIDYRRLNAITKRDVYPLPRIHDALAALEGNVYFSKLSYYL